MVNFGLVLSCLAAANIFAPVLAHPGEEHVAEDVRAEIAARDLHAKHISRGLANCAGKASYERLRERASERLSKKALELRDARGISHYTPYKTRRDLAALETFEAESHNATGKGYTASTKKAKLFAMYKNSSCVLTPEITQGPYWITGEKLRKNVVQGQAGVPVHLEYQFIDTSTCDAVPDVYVDTWQANATGVYSGVVANGNGNSADATNINNTFLRGGAVTGKGGYVAFDTIFAGHYQGRATHIHLLAQTKGKVLKNNTYHDGTVNHVGQIFFPMALREAVEKVSPYSTNTQAVTTNDEDTWAPDEADNDYDPFPEFAYLGSDISDGLLMWISVGIDTSATYTPAAAGSWTKNGGVASDSGLGGGGNGTAPSGGNGTMTGSFPTGSMTGGGSPPGSTATVTSSAKTTSTTTKTTSKTTASTSK